MLDLFLALLQAATNWFVWLPLLLAGALKLLFVLIDSPRFNQAGLAEIDRMDGLQFEQYLESLFRRLGYQVERTPYTGDKGADLILTRAGERIAVQAKRHSRKVGNRAVQEVYAAMPVYGCTRAIVVANQEFTESAIAQARSCQVELWGRQRLTAVLRSLKGQEPVEAAAPAQQPEAPSVPTCQRCGRPMVQRKSRRGPFWGCPGYPRCRFTLDRPE